MQLGLPVVELGDVLHDREAEAGSAKRAASFLVNPVEAFEDARLILLGDPASVIRYGNDRVILIA